MLPLSLLIYGRDPQYIQKRLFHDYKQRGAKVFLSKHVRVEK